MRRYREPLSVPTRSDIGIAAIPLLTICRGVAGARVNDRDSPRMRTRTSCTERPLIVTGRAVCARNCFLSTSEQQVKNITRPVRVFDVKMTGETMTLTPDLAARVPLLSGAYGGLALAQNHATGRFAARTSWQNPRGSRRRAFDAFRSCDRQLPNRAVGSYATRRAAATRQRPTCSRRWTTPTASATARGFTGSRACPREGGGGIFPSDFFRRNVVLSFQEDATGIAWRDVIGPDNMMWDNMMWGSSRPFPNRARSLRRSWPGCRTTNRPSQPRTTIQGSPAEHRPRVQFRRGEADPPRLKSQPLCGSTSSPRPRCSRRPRASGPGSTWRRPWPS
jgi:hypothetical protein